MPVGNAISQSNSVFSTNFSQEQPSTPKLSSQSETTQVVITPEKEWNNISQKYFHSGKENIVDKEDQPKIIEAIL